ncbi:MAG: class I SAM-dependent methyltransferase [Deltaproteobacteria bacterium]|nr:class I SAM-dependent methyltransferase [Deltaproteobacteria bacterium]
MTFNSSELLEQIGELPEDWHGCGSVSHKVLQAIADHAQETAPIYHSVETGAGKTTLLFSQLSQSHLVFAVDAGMSITRVRESPLLNGQHVTFLEGPSQRTLPRYEFTHKVQIALIDGPHGYPFPDIEYYYFYQLIETGGLLLIDDINIPTIGRMFEIIKVDDMFDLIDIVDNTAFFKRSVNPMFPPEEDGWWLQGFNREHYNRTFGGFRLTKLALRKTYEFKVGGSGLPLLKSGFSLPESQLVWTNGPKAVMAFEMPQFKNDLELSVTAYPFAPPTLGDDQSCEVYLNDNRIATWRLIGLPVWRRQFRKLWPNNKPFTAIIHENLVRPGEIFQLSFKFNKLTSPKQVGHSGDSRLLGLAFERLSLGPASSDPRMKSMGSFLKNMLRR